MTCSLGQFGENFTVSGLDDHDVCIGDRYRIGEAEFEVTQPRVTCFRVGMRLGVPEMPNLLVSQHRPGFYFRVITEGLVRAGDDIVLTRRGRHELSVADVDALLYLPDRDMDLLRKTVDVPALSPGWQQSFRDMLAEHEKPVAPTQLPIGVEPGWRGFRRLRVTATHRESPTVLSIRLEADDGGPLPTPLPGQYLTVKIPGAGDPPPMRSYSLSGDPAEGYYRISVKREDHGQVSQWLHRHARAGSIIESAAPRGDFYLVDDSSPVILVSAGIGATPVMAMAHALADGEEPAPDLVAAHDAKHRDSRIRRTRSRPCSNSLPDARQHVFYTRGDEATASRPASRRRRSRTVACRPTRRHTSAAPPRSWTTCVTPSSRPGSIPRTSTPNCSAPCRRSTPAWSARRRQYGHTLPKVRRAGTADHLRPQRTQRQLVTRLPHPPRIRGGVRRANPVFMPKRCLPHVRDPGDRGNDRTISSRRWKRPPTAPCSCARRTARPISSWISDARVNRHYRERVQRRRLDPPAGPLLAEDDGALLHARGIRYARAARFAAPQPIAPWSDVLDATTRGPVCPQLPSRLEWVTGPVVDGLAMSEDCQVLSVDGAQRRDRVARHGLAAWRRVRVGRW